jgi:hypothetical protein
VSQDDPVFPRCCRLRRLLGRQLSIIQAKRGNFEYPVHPKDFDGNWLPKFTSYIKFDHFLLGGLVFPDSRLDIACELWKPVTIEILWVIVLRHNSSLTNL